MIHPVHESLDGATHVGEIDQQARGVKLLAGDCNPHPVIVSVNILTLSLIATQGVSGAKTVIDGDFKHNSCERNGLSGRGAVWLL